MEKPVEHLVRKPCHPIPGQRQKVKRNGNMAIMKGKEHEAEICGLQFSSCKKSLPHQRSRRLSGAEDLHD